jgi:hypothetical protein
MKRVAPLNNEKALGGVAAIPRPNSDDELAVSLIQAGRAELGLPIDGVQKLMGVIQKSFADFQFGV